MKVINKKIIISVLCLIEICSLFLMYKSFNNKNTVLDDVIVKEKDKELFAVMIEGVNGDYTEYTSDNSFPGSGYKYNEDKSGCIDIKGNKIENALTFDTTNNIATIETGSTAYCYLYFDKILVPPVIVDVTKSVMNRTITLNIYTESENKIANYYYSIDNGTTFESSSTSSFTISGLSQGTTYNIVVYVVDVNGLVSDKYSLSATTLCFVAGTQVSTSKGLKNIEDIKVGEYVFTINEETNKKELKKVIDTITSSTIITYKITIGNETVEASPRHPFYVIDKGWTRAYNLNEGDLILSTKGAVMIDNIKTKYYKEEITTYNLTVEDNHNYLITGGEWLVHNSAYSPDTP